jgi:hypothetical protein
MASAPKPDPESDITVGSASALDDRIAVGPCPGCGAPLAMGIAKDPRGGAEPVEVMAHPSPHCDYYRNTSASDIVNQLVANKAETDGLSDLDALRLARVFRLIDETALAHVRREFKTLDNGDSLIIQRCRCGGARDVTVPAEHDLDTKESIARDALTRMQDRHRHCGLPS